MSFKLKGYSYDSKVTFDGNMPDSLWFQFILHSVARVILKSAALLTQNFGCSALS